MNTSRPTKRSAWFRKLTLGAGIVIVLIAVAYFIITSSAFLKASVLPRVGKAIGAEVNATEVSLSPFSQVVLKSARLQTTGAEPLLTADEVKVRYDLFSILRGNIELREVTVAGPVVHLVTDADGRSNLDPLLQSMGRQPAQAAKSTEAVRLDLKNVNLKNGKVRMITKSKDGSSQTVELANLNLTLDQLRNGGSGTINLSSEILFEQSASAGKGLAADRLQAKMSGEFVVGLDSQLMPSSFKGAARFDLARAEGSFKDLAGLSGSLHTDATMTEIRQLAVKFERGGKALGSIAASGPFNLNTLETRLKLEIQSIDRQVLNLFGAAQGWDFADSVLNSTNSVEVTQKGSSIAATGALTGSRIGIRQGSATTPPLDLNLNYQVSVNLDRKNALVQKLNLLGTENQRPLIEVSLDRPMSVNWGGPTAGIPDSTLQLVLHDFNLQSWQAVLGTNVPSGKVNLRLGVQTQQEGKRLNTKLSGDIQDLAARVGTNQIDRAQARFQLSGQADDLRTIAVDHYRFELLQNNRPVASSSGSLQCDLSKHELSLKADAEGSLTELLKPFPISGLNAASGQFKVNAAYNQDSQRQTASGQLTLTNFTGRYAEYQLQNFQTSADYDVDIAQGLVQVRRAKATFAQAGQSGGSLDISGQCRLTNGSVQLSFKLADLNQQILRPILAPSLGEMQLASISLNGQGIASYDPRSESTVKADFAVANWVMKDPKTAFPTAPVSGRIQVDGSLRQNDLDLRQLVLDVTSGSASAGHVDFQGKFNLTNYAGAGTFKIADFDQTVLRPVLAPSLGENQLVSISVNGSASASRDPKGDSVVKADVKVANWVVADAQKKLPRTPLSAQIQLDGSIRKQLFDLRQVALKLSPTARANNELRLQGRIDLSATNATPSQLSLQADSLDLTPYYDLFAGSTATNPPVPKPPTAATPQTNEPAPMQLPVQQLTADLKVIRCFLRDVALTNLLVSAKIDKSEITLKPFQFALNGAPVSGSASFNVGVPGYKYDLSLTADKLPLGPLASSFGSRSSSGLQGTLIANAQIKGAGITGAGLQKNLAGQVALSLTNMNYEIVGRKTKALLDPIALVLRVPELTLTPLEWVNAKAELGQGRINVSQFSVFSQALSASGQGTIQIAPVLTNSTLDLPVAISLRRSLADKARLTPSGTAPDVAYVPLPTFAKMAGTLGDPKTEIDKLVVSGLLLRSAGGIPKVGEKTGNVLQGLGELLSGQKPPLTVTNVPPLTNSISGPRTNKPPKFNPLDLLELIPKKK